MIVVPYQIPILSGQLLIACLVSLRVLPLLYEPCDFSVFQQHPNEVKKSIQNEVSMDFNQKVKEINSLLEQHNTFRGDCLNLIASENVPSPLVEGLLVEDLGSALRKLQRY